jgi:hypothetical protein
VSEFREFSTLLREFVANTDVRPLTLREWSEDLQRRSRALGIEPPPFLSSFDTDGLHTGEWTSLPVPE